MPTPSAALPSSISSPSAGLLPRPTSTSGPSAPSSWIALPDASSVGSAGATKRRTPPPSERPVVDDHGIGRLVYRQGAVRTPSDPATPASPVAHEAPGDVDVQTGSRQ